MENSFSKIVGFAEMIPAPSGRWIRAFKDFQYGHLACGLMPGGLKPCCSGRKHQNACCEHPRDLLTTLRRLRLRGGYASAPGFFAWPLGSLLQEGRTPPDHPASAQPPRRLRISAGLFRVAPEVFITGGAVAGGLKLFCSGRKHQITVNQNW